ncbi:uncharacterized protein METZ01_LOCUS513175, partial [marine metagenome]
VTGLGLFPLQMASVTESQGGWEPFLPGLIILLPLLGFGINGGLALSAARRSSNAVRSGQEFDFFEGSRPVTHSLPTW